MQEGAGGCKIRDREKAARRKGGRDTEYMKLKKLLSRLKRFAMETHAGMLFCGILVYTLLCYIYWMVEFGPGGKKSFLDILLWNNVNIVFSRGYTDYIPTSWKGRALLMVFVLFSMLFLSTMIGFVSSRIRDYSLSPARRIRKVQTLNGHVAILGWKNDIRTLITDIIRKSGGLTADDIVLVNNAPELKIQALLSDRELKGIHFIRGEFTEEKTLQDANIKKASTALVLGENHESLEAELVDSRVFVCTLMIKAMNPRCHMCALVQTERYRNYLEAQKCDEVIYAEEYSRYILSTATSYTGMANVLRAMFGSGGGASVQILPLDGSWKGKPYGDLARHLREAGTLPLGILENMGAENVIKHATLSEAMKSDNYAEIIRRLKTVKDTERNHPLLNPPDDYVLGGSMGVIVLKKEV